MQTRFTRRPNRLAAAVCLAACVLVLGAQAAAQGLRQTSERGRARRALIISLDGLDARYLLRRDEYGLKIPTLRRLLAEGASARGVVSVYPSHTYPSHTTMVTGALPARHGVYANESLDAIADPPPRRYNWFARAIKTETLWDAAARAGLTTGLVSWPVAGGAGDFNVPEIWKAGTSPSDDWQVTLREISANARPRGLVEEVAASDPELYRRVTRDEGDDMRTRFAEYIIEHKRPRLMLVHLYDLDHFEHDRGAFTPDSFEILEKSDAYVARLLAAASRAGTLRETAVFVVSDHGFRNVSKQINPGVLFARAGLVKTREERDANGKARAVVTDWRALPYVTAGSCAVILRDPSDREALEKVRGLVRAMQAMEGGLVARVLEAAELRRLGANPRAALMLEAGEGYKFGDRLTGELVTPSSERSTHGYLPTYPDYRAIFIASGAGIRRRGDLGEIRMTDIAPTVAGILKLKLRRADGRALKELQRGNGKG